MLSSDVKFTNAITFLKTFLARFQFLSSFHKLLTGFESGVQISLDVTCTNQDDIPAPVCIFRYQKKQNMLICKDSCFRTKF